VHEPGERAERRGEERARGERISRRGGRRQGGAERLDHRLARGELGGEEEPPEPEERLRREVDEREDREQPGPRAGDEAVVEVAHRPARQADRHHGAAAHVLPEDARRAEVAHGRR
jgi:hypothetical protein